MRICDWNVNLSGLQDQLLADRAVSALEQHLTWVMKQLPKPVCEVTRRSQIILNEMPNNVELATYHWTGSPVPGVEVFRTSRLLNCLAISGKSNPPATWNGYFIHEFGHSFQEHHLPKGPGNLEVKLLFNNARNIAEYKYSFNKINGQRGSHYALHDNKQGELEYFACLFCAYFDASDWEPATRDELRDHDPMGLAFIERIISSCIAG